LADTSGVIPACRSDAEGCDWLPDRFGFEPEREFEWRDLVTALRRAVDTELTLRQRVLPAVRDTTP
jgi:RNA polymerase sigma-70 factor (ECF subfamily)